MKNFLFLLAFLFVVGCKDEDTIVTPTQSEHSVIGIWSGYSLGILLSVQITDPNYSASTIGGISNNAKFINTFVEVEHQHPIIRLTYISMDSIDTLAIFVGNCVTNDIFDGKINVFDKSLSNMREELLVMSRNPRHQ